MMMGVFQEDQLPLHHFLHQKNLPVSERKMMTMKTVKMMKLGFSLLPDLVVRQQGTPLLGECWGNLWEVYAGH